MSVIWRGAEDVARRLGVKKAEIVDATMTSLYEESQDVLAEASREVPVDTGRLRASAYGEPPKVDGMKMSVRIGYGTNYALPVHERVEVKHKVGRAGWLRHVLERRASGYAQRIADRVRRRIGS